MLSASANATLATQGEHPRILARRQRVAAAKRRDTLLARLDRLIDSIEYAAKFTNQFSSLVAPVRDLRDQMAFADLESADTLSLLAQIDRHMVDITNVILNVAPPNNEYLDAQ